MITETKEIYKCEHCKKLYQVKRWCEYHELTCVKRPDNLRSCHNCILLTKKDETVYYDSYNGENSRVVNLLYCPKKNIFVYPPRVEIKQNWFDTGDISNEPMPRECLEFEPY